MSNDYFRFKQFEIQQGKSGMKVTTEGCLLGVLTDLKQVKNVLDIGCGTGLLALMLAQRTDAPITGVELEAGAFADAKRNASNSPWSERVDILQMPIQEYKDQSDEKFDLIVSNPPFFRNHEKGHDDKKAMAVHDDSLSASELVSVIDALLIEKGHAVVMYPDFEMEVFEQGAKRKGLFLEEKIRIYNRVNDQHIFRMICSFVKNEGKTTEKDFFIRNERGEYTSQFIQLLKPYYLYL